MSKFIGIDAICALCVVLFFYSRHVIPGDSVGWPFILIGLVVSVIGLSFKASALRKAISIFWVFLFSLPVGFLAFMILLFSH